MQRMFWAFFLASLLLGCADRKSDFKTAHESTRLPKSQSINLTGGTEMADSGVDEPVAAAKRNAPRDRKIIYTAEINLVVESLDETSSAIDELVETHEGYIANFHEDRPRGELRAADWVVRVPVKNFEDLLKSVADLGVPESRNVDTEDVTEQFVDLEARLKVRRQLEQELLELLEERDGQLKDLIAVKEELTNVREEIERIEGVLRHLTNRVELTTITIHAREDRGYEPEQAPTFLARIGDSWGRSLAAMRSFGESVVIAVVVVAPWLAVLMVALAAPILLWRWRRRRVAPRQA